MTTFPHIRQCTNPDCEFRFPVAEFDKYFKTCPKCKASTIFICNVTQYSPSITTTPPDIRVSLLLDNLRSVFNVGSIFRSADGCGIVEQLYLSGTSPTPDHPKMAKTALGAEKVIPWSYHPNGLILAKQLIKSGKTLVALELTEHSVQLRVFLENKATENVVFIVGNEITGIDPMILEIAHHHIHLPMYGIKESLNVAIAASIICYSL